MNFWDGKKRVFRYQWPRRRSTDNLGGVIGTATDDSIPFTRPKIDE